MMSSGDGVMMSSGGGVMMSGDVDVYEDLVDLCVTLLTVEPGLPLVGMSEVLSSNTNLPSTYLQLCVVLLLSDLCVVLLPVSSVDGVLV